MKYLFIRMFEDGAKVKLTEDLDEFKTFCHYSSLSDWETHKQLILKSLERKSIYAFTGNDVWYYILVHDVWNICDPAELDLLVSGNYRGEE